VPTTTVSKVFTIFYALISIGVFVALVTQMADALIHPSKKQNSSGSKDESTDT